MATKGFITLPNEEFPIKGIRQGDILGYWEMQAGDVALPLICPRYSDKSVHMFGTWNGASVTLKGGNDPALTQFEDVYDPDGTAITQAAARKPWVIMPNLLAIKPVITGGDGTTLIKIAIVGKGANV